jgi:hypothetical protein
MWGGLSFEKRCPQLLIGFADFLLPISDEAIRIANCQSPGGVVL